MKKIRNSIVVIIILVTLLQSFGVCALTSSDNPLLSKTAPILTWAFAISDDISSDDLVYDLNPSSAVWKDLSSKQEMINACNISDVTLSSMSTEELVNAALSFPLLINLFAYNS